MTPQHQADIAALRAFNRLYTRRLGLLHPRLDGSPFSLSEARVLYELAHRAAPTAAQIARALDLDRAQISRTLKRFADRRLIETREDPDHARQRLLRLTPAGRAAFAALEAGAEQAIGALLDGLAPARRRRLLQATGAIEAVFASQAAPTVDLRGLRVGDLGLVTARQAALYAQEYGWNQDFEALVAGIVSQFHTDFDPARDDAWIAEIDGEMAGSIFLVRGEAPGEARLRLLYVEPQARGAGVGRRLTAACIARARELGYDRLVLWTNSVLTAARRIYETAGFERIGEAPHRSFGHDLVGETWRLDLRRPPSGA